MSSGLKDTLRKRLDENYTAFMESLQVKTASELIAMAPEITAAKQCHEELLDACDEDDVAFLLQFDDPLEVVRGFWESEITGYDHSEEMGHMLWEIRDKAMYSKEAMNASKAMGKPKIQLAHQDEDISTVLDQAVSTLLQAGQQEQVMMLLAQTFGVKEQDALLQIIGQFVEVERPTTAQSEKTKNKRRCSHER